MGSPRTGEIYEGDRRSDEDVRLTAQQAADLREMEVDQRKQQLAKLKELESGQDGGALVNPQPDLRTIEGQIAFLDYHAPDEEQAQAHQAVNSFCKELWYQLAAVVPAGPGLTRLLHKVQAVRMEANCAIANRGA